VPQETASDEENERFLTAKEERILKKTHDIQERKQEDSRRLTEKWTQQELEQAKNERHRGTKERSESEESSEEDSRRREERPKINMIRAEPKKEVVLTPAPGWQEAVGRPEVRGEDVTTEEGVREVEVRFVPRTRINEARDDEEREIPEIQDKTAIMDAEEGINIGRYAHEARERIPGPRPKTEEEQARSEMTYFDYLKW
jgi:hypothetical protein